METIDTIAKQIYDLKQNGLSFKEISEELDLSKSKVFRIYKTISERSQNVPEHSETNFQNVSEHSETNFQNVSEHSETNFQNVLEHSETDDEVKRLELLKEIKQMEIEHEEQMKLLELKKYKKEKKYEKLKEKYSALEKKYNNLKREYEALVNDYDYDDDNSEFILSDTLKKEIATFLKQIITQKRWKKQNAIDDINSYFEKMAYESESTNFYEEEYPEYELLDRLHSFLEDKDDNNLLPNYFYSIDDLPLSLQKDIKTYVKNNLE